MESAAKRVQLLLAPINPTGADERSDLRVHPRPRQAARPTTRTAACSTSPRRARSSACTCSATRSVDARRRGEASRERARCSPSSGRVVRRRVRTRRRTPRSPREAAGRAVHGVAKQDALRRLASDWLVPEVPARRCLDRARASAREDEIEFSWVGETARHVGSVVHRWLQRIAEDELEGLERGAHRDHARAFRERTRRARRGGERARRRGRARVARRSPARSTIRAAAGCSGRRAKRATNTASPP